MCAFNFRRLSNWRKMFNGENFPIYGSMFDSVVQGPRSSATGADHFSNMALKQGAILTETMSVHVCVCTVHMYIAEIKQFCLSVCLPARVSVCLSACVSACVSVCLSVCLPACSCVCLSACSCACLSICLPACLLVCLSACLSACVSVCLWHWTNSSFFFQQAVKKRLHDLLVVMQQVVITHSKLTALFGLHGKNGWLLQRIFSNRVLLWLIISCVLHSKHFTNFISGSDRVVADKTSILPTWSGIELWWSLC